MALLTFFSLTDQFQDRDNGSGICQGWFELSGQTANSDESFHLFLKELDFWRYKTIGTSIFENPLQAALEFESLKTSAFSRPNLFQLDLKLYKRNAPAAPEYGFHAKSIGRSSPRSVDRFIQNLEETFLENPKVKNFHLGLPR